MRLTKENENLNLPEYIKFGLELEVENLDQSQISKKIKDKKWKAEADMSLTDGGTECVSPVLQEKEDSSVWEDVSQICQSIKDSPRDKDREAYTDHTCGGHIHFDAGIFRKNPEIMKNFLKLWAESEELIYKMCNEKGDVIRSSALQHSDITIKDVIKATLKNPLPEDKNISSIKDCIKLCKKTGKNMLNNMINGTRKLNTLLVKHSSGKNGMAYPRGRQIQEQIESGKLKLAKPKKRTVFREMLAKHKLDAQRYTGLNLSNMGSKSKDTIEFRMSNGSINPQTIKENVFLYASLIKTAVDMTEHPEEMQDALKNFYKRDVTEEEKADAFLSLVMEHPEDRQVYKDRWESVKDNPIFSQSIGAQRFSKDVFQKEAEIQPTTEVKKAYGFISKLKDKVLGKESKKEDVAFEH